MPQRVVALLVPLLLASACSSRVPEARVPPATPSVSATVTPVATTPTPEPPPTATASPTTAPGPAESVTARSGVSTLTVWIDHGSAPTATLLHLHLVVASRSGAWNGGQVRYGDGQSYSEPVAMASCVRFGPSGPPRAGPSSRADDLLVSYRVPGRYTLDVQATTDAMCATGPTEQLHAQLQVLVTPGPRLANGPQPPGEMASVAATPVSGGTELEAFQLADPDGVVTSVRWDLGDGTHKTVRVSGTCSDPGNRWPLDKGKGYSRLVHRYARHGTYRVRVVVTSAGCHGGNLQQHAVNASVRA